MRHRFAFLGERACDPCIVCSSPSRYPLIFAQQVYNSLTGGFSGSAAQQAGAGATGGGSGGGGGGGGGGPAGGGGGGGGGTNSSSKNASKSAKSSSGRNQLVTSVTSRDVREKYEIERSQLGHGHYGVVRRCWDKESREVRDSAMVLVFHSNCSRFLRFELGIAWKGVGHAIFLLLYTQRPRGTKCPLLALS